MAALQEGEQRLLVFFRHGLTGSRVRQTRFLHLRQQTVNGRSHCFRELLYCHLRHAKFSLIP